MLYRTVHNRDNPYVTVNKTIVKDNRLSWKAKGIWFYAFSKPNDWQFNKKDLLKQSLDSKKSLESGLQELESTGYLWRAPQKQNESGQFEKRIWYFFEVSKTEEEMLEIQKSLPKPNFGSTGKKEREIQKSLPQPQKGETVKGETEKEPLLSNEILNNEILKKGTPNTCFSTNKQSESLIEPEKPHVPFFEMEIEELLEEACKKYVMKEEEKNSLSYLFSLKDLNTNFSTLCKWAITYNFERLEEAYLYTKTKIKTKEPVGAYMRKVLENKWAVGNKNILKNIEIAKMFKSLYQSVIEIKKKYIYILFSNGYKHEIPLTIIPEEFKRSLENKLGSLL